MENIFCEKLKELRLEKEIGQVELAKQLNVNAFFAGHYATERFGVRALGEWLAEKAPLDVSFIDFNLPY